MHDEARKPKPLTAERVRQLLAYRDAIAAGRVKLGVPDSLPDPTEIRLQLDKILFPPRSGSSSSGCSPG
jgi:hypothetical protein